MCPSFISISFSPTISVSICLISLRTGAILLLPRSRPILMRLLSLVSAGKTTRSALKNQRIALRISCVFSIRFGLLRNRHFILCIPSSRIFRISGCRPESGTTQYHLSPVILQGDGRRMNGHRIKVIKERFYRSDLWTNSLASSSTD